MDTSSGPGEGEGPDVLTLYWMPGCSSCLRMKEFVEQHGAPHRAVNVVEAPESVEQLRRRGLVVPAAVRGDRGAPGVDLVAVAALAGIDYTPPEMLSPAELATRYRRVMEVAEALLGQLSPDQLDHCEPDRPRSMRELGLHIATIMRGFVDVEDSNYFAQGYEFLPQELVAEGGGGELVIAEARRTRDQFEEWWTEVGAADLFDRIVESKSGAWRLHEAFERAVWHTAQHTRQLQYFTSHRFGVDLADELSEADLAGLPIPDGIHAGG